MVDEHKLLIDRDRAARAQALLENDLLKEAFAYLEAAYIEKWRSTEALDTAAREKLYLAVNAIGKLREHFASVVSDGKLAAHELKALAETTERKKRFGII